MKKVVIIDDEPLARQVLTEYLAAHEDLTVVDECGNGYEGIRSIQKHRPDLVILDIQMPKINGFEMLELLEELPHVIFATAFDAYAIRAFEANAIDYLLKPFSRERLATAISKWRTLSAASPANDRMENFMAGTRKQQEERNRIVVRNNMDISIIPTAEVVYIEAFDDYVKIFTKDTFHLKKKTMNYYEEVLDPAVFFRCHRSFIINLGELTRIEPLEKNSYVVLLRSGKRIPLSRSAYGRLKAKLGL